MTLSFEHKQVGTSEILFDENEKKIWKAKCLNLSLTCPPNSVVIHLGLGFTPKSFQHCS